MSTSDPETHLLRAQGTAETAVRRLSSTTGMTRVGLEERRLAAGDHVRIAGPPAAEGFIYVLTGSGRVAAAAESGPIAAGDFLAIDPDEVLTLENPHGETLTFLVAFSEGGADAIASSP
jgi:uncharacterized cupin superfamily protein